MKKWYQSKTLWFNILTFIVALLTAILDEKLFTDPVAISIFTFFLTVGNLALRIFFTAEPIEGTPPARRIYAKKLPAS